MEEVREVKEKKNKEKESRFGKRDKFELKLRCVKLHLEEGLSISLLSKEVGASTEGWSSFEVFVVLGYRATPSPLPSPYTYNLEGP